MVFSWYLIYADVVQVNKGTNSAPVGAGAFLAAATDNERDQDWSKIEKYAAIHHVFVIERRCHEVDDVTYLVYKYKYRIINPVDSLTIMHSSIVEGQVIPAFASDGLTIISVSYLVKLRRSEALFSPSLGIKFFVILDGRANSCDL